MHTLLSSQTEGGQTDDPPPPLFAIIRDRDPALFDTLSRQLRQLGVGEVVLAQQPCAESMRQEHLTPAPPKGLLVSVLRDAVMGPVELGDIRAWLPGWVIIAVDTVDNAHSAAEALAAGADDVVRAPIVPREFAARLALRMRQAGMPGAEAALLPALFTQANLTPIESSIMHILLINKGQIVTRSRMAQLLDQSEWDYGDRKFDVHVTRIRKKLKAAFGDTYVVRTVRSQGYLFQVAEDNITA